MSLIVRDKHLRGIGYRQDATLELPRAFQMYAPSVACEGMKQRMLLNGSSVLIVRNAWLARKLCSQVGGWSLGACAVGVVVQSCPRIQSYACRRSKPHCKPVKNL
jgi:hypothetical protein